MTSLRPARLLVVTSLFLATAACSPTPTGGGQVGVLKGTGDYPIPIDAKADVLTLDVSVHLSAGAASLRVEAPNGHSFDIATVVAPAEFRRTVELTGIAGRWSAVWTTTAADGTYDMSWR